MNKPEAKTDLLAGAKPEELYHLGSCKGVGRRHKNYHGGMWNDQQKLVWRSCPCCVVPVECPACRAVIEQEEQRAGLEKRGTESKTDTKG